MGIAKLKSAIAAAGRDESGATLVEFAISLAILAPLFIGTIDFGVGLFRWLQVNDMAEAGALYATTNAQQLYSGPNGGGAFQYSNISGAATSAGAGLTGATTNVVGACSCLPTLPTNCPSATQFAGSNAANPYCSATCSPSESAYVCITSSYAYTPLITVPYISGPITLSATSMVKIH